MIYLLFTVLCFNFHIALSTELDFSSCFGTPSFVEPPIFVSSDICKLNKETRPATNICDLYENDRFKLTFKVEKTVCSLSVEVAASAVDEKNFSLDGYSNIVIPANITADHDLNKYYLYLDITNLPMRRANYCFVFRGGVF